MNITLNSRVLKKVPLVFIRRIPADLRSHYRSDRLCLSLRPKFE